MIRIRVPLEDFRALLFQDSGATPAVAVAVAVALAGAREPAACPAKAPHRGTEASHAH